MALLVECPKCKKRNSTKISTCKCGLNIKKAAHKNYWIEFYYNGRKTRKRIGPSKAAAEQRLREVLKLRTEERYIDKDKLGRMTLGELSIWYLKLREVMAKDSYERDKQLTTNLKRLLCENIKLKHITPGRMESYQQERLAEPSRRNPKKNTRPATINRELAVLKTMFNRAVRHNVLDRNPIASVKRLAENNVRMRILTQEEFDHLLAACADHIRPIVQIAYYMGMRFSEILFLVWAEVDLKKGFIRLSAERTKTDTPRNIPIHPAVQTILESLPRGLHTDRVFLFDGQPFNEMKLSFKGACRRAGIRDFTFHDLRHCALNNLRLAGNDYFKIMSISGHKTMSVFKRYNLVTEEELSQIKWPEQGRIAGTMDTNMDTWPKKEVAKNG
jgi:integrase